MAWVGGKKALRDIIVPSFPLRYERYIEVFGGAGWILFHKQPERFEVFNDANSLLVNLYRCVREKPDALKAKLRYVLNAREDFEQIRKNLTPDSPQSDVERAAMFFLLIRYSYASGLKSFASQPHDVFSDFAPITAAHRRLGGAVIENQDFAKLIRHYDRPESFFYCDPPYWETEGYYQNIGKGGFTPEDHLRLRDMLFSIDGKFLLSYNDHPYIWELYSAPGITIRRISRLNTIKQRYENGCLFDELLISNYDQHERENRMPRQMNLFGAEGVYVS